MPPHPALLWVARGLAFTAALVAGYLLWVALAGEGHVAGCGSDGPINCDHVLSSRWSRVIGVPVSLPAVVLYTLVLLALFGVSPDASEQNQTYAWRLLLILTLLAGLGGWWFIGLQVFVIKSFCPFCLVVHGCGLLLLGFVLAWGPLRLHTPSRGQIDPLLIGPGTIGAMLAAGLLGVALLAGVQSLYAPVKEDMDVVEVPLHADSSIEATSHTANKAETEPLVDRAPPEQPLVNPPPSDDPSVGSLPSKVATEDEPSNGDVGVAESASGNESDPLFDPELEELLSSKSPPPKRDAPAIKTETHEGPTASNDPRADAPSAKARRHRRVSMLNGAIRLDAGEQPVIGSLDATCLVVEMFDYTCPHCRVLHRYMHQAQERYGDQLAVLLVCVPMSSSCNKHVQSTGSLHVNACIYARLAMAVWMRAPDKFPAFHNWLMDPDKIPTPTDARSEAARILGENSLGDSILDETLSDPALDAHVTANTDHYKQAGAGVIPKIIYDRVKADGEPASAQKLFEVFEKHMGLRPLTPNE